MIDAKKALWTPQGIVDVNDEPLPLERVELNDRDTFIFGEVEGFFKKFEIGLHCGLCGKDVGGKNDEFAKVHAAACGCRTFIGTNQRRRQAN